MTLGFSAAISKVVDGPVTESSPPSPTAPNTSAAWRARGVLLIGGDPKDTASLVQGMVQCASPVAPLISITASSEQGVCSPNPEGYVQVWLGPDAPGIAVEAIAPEAEVEAGDSGPPGSIRSFHVHATQHELGRAVQALLRRLPPEYAVVCRSRDLRTTLEPDVYLLSCQPSGAIEAPEALDHVDQVLPWHRDAPRLDFSALSFLGHARRWCFRHKAAAIVLAGGRSSRMGTDKARLQIDGIPLLHRIVDALRPHFDAIAVSARSTRGFLGLDVPVIADLIADSGPLAALHASLRASQYDANLVVACDNPEVNLDLALRLLRASRGVEAVVPRSGRQVDPLFAVYRRQVIPHIESLLEGGRLSVRALLERCETRWLELPANEMPKNLNTRIELEAYLHQRVVNPSRQS